MRLVKRFSIAGRIGAFLSIKKRLVNFFGLKMPNGYGWVRNPGKFIYNKVYNRVNKKPTEWIGLK